MKRLLIPLYLLFSSLSFGQFADTLYPPINFDCIGFEDCAYLTWDQPEVSGFPDSVPAGLFGYIVYKNDDSLSYVPYIDSVQSEYYDFNLVPGNYLYSATALYELTPYGYPGDTAESAHSNQDSIHMHACPLPFFEDWGFGNFVDWEVDCQNWQVIADSGYPAPAAYFIGFDTLLFDYHCSIRSHPKGIFEPSEGRFLLEFDLMLDASLDTSSVDFFIVNVIIDYESSYTIDTFIVNGDFGWTGYLYDITSYCNGEFIQLEFIASGENSTSIISWAIDNIHIYRICDPPIITLFEPELVGNDTMFHICWSPADTNTIGYNLFRMNESGDWTIINDAWILDTCFYDSLYSNNQQYCLGVTSVYNTCESDMADTCYSVYVHAPPLQNDKMISLYPNPATNRCFMSSVETVDLIRIYDQFGRLVKSIELSHSRQIELDLNDINSGVYYLHIKTQSGTSIRKLIK